MANPSKAKGSRRERQIVDRLRALGALAQRVPLSGAAQGQFGGDVRFNLRGNPKVAEVKARAEGAGFKVIEKWLGGNDALFLVRDRQPPLVVLTWEFFEELVRDFCA